MKRAILFILSLFLVIPLFSQDFDERIIVEPRPEYTLKFIGNTANGSQLIPKADSSNNPSLILNIDQSFDRPNNINNALKEFQKGTNTPFTISIIEKLEKGKHQFVIFKMENTISDNQQNSKSSLYYMIQGKELFFTMFVETKKELFTEDFIAKWITIFKRSVIKYENN